MQADTEALKERVAATMKMREEAEAVAKEVGSVTAENAAVADDESMKEILALSQEEATRTSEQLRSVLLMVGLIRC